MSGLRHASKTLYIKAKRMALFPAKEKNSAQKGGKQGKRPKKKRTETTIRFKDNLPNAIDEKHNIVSMFLITFVHSQNYMEFRVFT